MDWLKDFTSEELAKFLDGDTQIIFDSCGIDVLASIWAGNLMGMSLHISTKPLFALKKAYIRKHYNGHNIKDLAIKLRMSERTVFRYAQNLEKVKKVRK